MAGIKKVSFGVALVAIAFVFLSLVLFVNLVFDKARIDLTQGNIYSISSGSHQIIENIDEPINLYFFFSNKATEGLTSLRNYATRVQSLLEEYELYSDGKINLHIIDPEPFSEAEDKAAEMGLTAAPIGLDDPIYMGLAATNALDDKKTIAFFDPSQEVLLEYEISKLIYQLSNPEPTKVAVLSSLPVGGGMNSNPMAMQMGQMPSTPAWASYSQLQQLYDVELLAEDSVTIPEETKVLILIHPKSLTIAQRFAIEQFVFRGGKLLVFVDPLAESDLQNPGMMGIPDASSSNLTELFAAWGIEYDSSQVVIDAANGLEIRMPSGQPGRHVGYIGIEPSGLNGEEVPTASLSSINLASAGALTKTEAATTEFTPLITSSLYSAHISNQSYLMSAQDPEQLMDGFMPLEVSQTLAAKIAGPATTAFENVPEGFQPQDWIKQTDNIDVIVVADTDMLTDGFWVQVSNFFGQQVLQPFANNGDLFINFVDHLGGSSELMSVRGRGQYLRPFEVVDELTLAAEEKFREQEQQLQQQLEETESQLAQLQSQGLENGNLTLTAEQEQAIEQFMAKKLTIRKELREVRHQLDKDIEALGSRIKLVNIVIMPLLLTLLLAFLARGYRNRLIIHPNR